MYQLINTQTLICNEEIRCDATQMYFDRRRADKEWDLKFSNDLMIIIKHKDCKIPKGKSMVIYDFVDDETGEMFELRCGAKMDEVAIRNELYPRYLLWQMKQPST